MSEAHCNNLAQRKALGLVTHDNTGGPFVVECQGCGEVYASFHCLGGGQIADTGDYDDARCPHCDQVDPHECDNAGLAWNTQQAKINELQHRLTTADQRIDELEAGIKWETERNALLLASLTEAEDMLSITSLEAGRRIDELEAQLRDAELPTGLIELPRSVVQALYNAVRESDEEGLSVHADPMVTVAEALGCFGAAPVPPQAEMATCAKSQADAQPVAGLSKEDWTFIGGLVAKHYQNAKRSVLRAGTPLRSAEASSRLSLAERLLHSLSTRADAGEVERLRLELTNCTQAFHMLKAGNSALRAKLAERDADAERWKFYAPKVADRVGVPLEQMRTEVDAAMSASAEPNDACVHSYANKLGCPECGEEFASAEPAKP